MLCNIKEADGHMFVHVRNAIEEFPVLCSRTPWPPRDVARVWSRRIKMDLESENDEFVSFAVFCWTCRT